MLSQKRAHIYDNSISVKWPEEENPYIKKNKRMIVKGWEENQNCDCYRKYRVSPGVGEDNMIF